MHLLEPIYDFILIFGIAIMTVTSLGLPKKVKCVKGARLILPHWIEISEQTFIIFTLLFIVSSMLVPIVFFFGSSDLSGKGWIYLTPKNYWVPLFFIYTMLCGYTSMRLVEFHEAKSRRKTILYIASLYKLEVAPLHKLCKTYNFKLFPISHFEHLVSNRKELIGEEILKVMESDLSQCEHYQSIRKKMETMILI